MKKIGVLCMLLPFVFNTLNIQAFITKFLSANSAQNFAYLNVILVIIGAILLFKQKEPFAPIIKLWIVYFLFYYVIGTIASEIHGTETPYLKTLIPLIYFFGFSIYLSAPDYRPLFIKVCAATFFISSIVVIVFQRINFSMDHDGIYEYALERAGGVYGDANQAALASILSFILIFYFFKPDHGFLKFLRVLALLIATYALILTFSKTGFLVLLAVFGLCFHKIFSGKRMLISVILVPVILISGVNFALNSDALSPLQKERIENVVNIVTFNTENVQMSGRDMLLQNMLKYVYDNPIIGNGIYFSNIIRGHNTIIGVWADAGIICFLLFLLILFTYFKKSLNGKADTQYFSLSTMLALTVFMLSLQTIINQPYLLCLLVFLGYHLENAPKVAETPVEDDHFIPSVNLNKY
jgi:O-antigen ligase